MRSRKDIESEFEAETVLSTYTTEKLSVELLLDIREVLLSLEARWGSTQLTIKMEE